MKFNNFLITMLLSGFLVAQASADTDALVQQCNACHGENGVSQWTDMPTIAGLAEFVHADALFVYKDGDRPCADSEFRSGDTSQPATNMCQIAANLNDEQIEAIASVYAELPYVMAKQDFDTERALAGEAIHNQHCDRCHANAGMDAEDEAGMLGGQMSGYLRQTFVDYAAGERDQLDKMKEKMDLLSDDDVEALLHYYASQQ
ncbi:MAG: c-type cytochrome [Gammaproteobacteria bacterium]|nr:c-type cytochrome [Gammaproteobacteria bacterium]